MIILGDNYSFTPYELERLEKKTHKILYIKRNDYTNTETIEEIRQAIYKERAAAIVLNIGRTPTPELIRFLTDLELQGIRFFTLETFMETFLYKCYIPYDARDLSYLQNIRPFHPVHYFMKRILDITASILLLFLSLPAMLYAVYKIKKESPGPILYTQIRIGERNRPFTCYKFRSMHQDSHFDPYTRKNDNRIFPFGHFMRKSRIDELPQLVNVLKGDMHLIGPRAEWNILVEQYEQELPYYNERHLVKPGITGWAQVNYPYGANIEDTRQKLMYDLYYIKYWNLFLEVKIALKTVLVMLLKRGT